jgi:RND superfamily putative drug exporter
MMHLFGGANWWLPAAVDQRMPHLSVEPTEDAEDVVTVTDDDEVCTVV